jgi:hypothetical protein
VHLLKTKISHDAREVDQGVTWKKLANLREVADLTGDDYA